MDIVQLMSGYDSVAMALVLQDEGHAIFPLYVNFRRGGGKASKEMSSMRKVIGMTHFQPLKVIKHYIPKAKYDTRNRTLCKLAAHYAQDQDISHVAIGSQLFAGVALIGDFPRADVDPATLQASVPEGITVITGQMHKSVATYKLCTKDRRILFETTSCQLWYKDECGQCFSCVERHAAFVTVMGYDHTTYLFDPRVSVRWQKLLDGELTALAHYLKGQERE